MLRKSIYLTPLLLLCFVVAIAQPITIKSVNIIASNTIPSPVKETTVKMLTEEIQKRTSIALKSINGQPKSNEYTIALVLSSDKDLAGKAIPASANKTEPEFKAEGYRIVSELTDKGGILWVIGADARGVLFGAGWVLRKAALLPKSIQFDAKTNIATSPEYPIRGHQLGYRHTANSYDAWTVAQFDQYIRELAIFGSNAVEGIPFHEDESPSPHFKISSAEMRVKISEICQAYDQDYWVWTPVTFELTDTKKRTAELALHEDLYKKCPRLDHIFVPGGDPGDNHPREVLPFLKELHDRLVKYHPNGKIWLSLQGFSVEQVDYFYQYLKENKPTWLQGVVSGPGSPPMAETRYRLPKNYQHREYPDLTHNVRCEFPVRQWDQAYALTLGREACNPRPYEFAAIHQTYAPFTDGFLSYSDGCHDDINKVVWSMRAWNTQMDVREILVDYSNFFFGKDLAENMADGIAALENNWKGPLAQNGGVEATFAFWQNMEAKATPQLTENWRWQILLLRAYYDTYTRRRLIYEQDLEKQANAILTKAPQMGTDKAMASAWTVLEKAEKMPISYELRKKIEQLCQTLYTSIGLQTSVPKHQARNYERGCLLDFVDYPLNNRWWLEDEFKKLKPIVADSNAKVLARLKIISAWENPGAGSFYDDVSSISKGPRVKTIVDDATDIAWWDNGFSRTRLSTQTFQNNPELIYENLQADARYVIRVAGLGEALLRVDGKRLSPIVYNRENETFKEWIVPLNLSQDGQIKVSFDEPEESHLNWRKHSKVSDIWLLKQ
jgi:hypothetical protein